MPERMDKNGRVVIPKRLRMAVGLDPGSPLEFVAVPEARGVLVKKGKGDYCVSCGGMRDLIPLGDGVSLCRACAEKQVLPKLLNWAERK